MIRDLRTFEFQNQELAICKLKKCLKFAWILSSLNRAIYARSIIALNYAQNATEARGVIITVFTGDKAVFTRF